MRASELVGLRVRDVHLGTGRHIRVMGKRRKKRATPLTNGVAAALLRQWITERGGGPDDPLFPTGQGRPLSRYTVRTARGEVRRDGGSLLPVAQHQDVNPHVLRHSAAMLWRAKGVDIATIAFRLGHESTQTTRIYEHADPALKEEAIARTVPLGVKPGRFQPPDTLLAFLEGL